MTAGNSYLAHESRAKWVNASIAKPISFSAMNILARRVKELREEKELSQAELAARMPIYCSQNVIASIETGKTRNPRYIYELAMTLGVSVAYLKGLTDDRTVDQETNEGLAKAREISPEEWDVIIDYRDLKKKRPDAAEELREFLRLRAQKARNK